MSAQYSVPPLKGSEDSIKWFSCMNHILSFEESKYLASAVEKTEGKYKLNDDKEKLDYSCKGKILSSVSDAVLVKFIILIQLWICGNIFKTHTKTKNTFLINNYVTIY